MKTISRGLTKGAIGAATAGAMALTGANPAFARDRYDRDGIDAGEIIAGAVILGGIAAIASAASKDRNNYSYRGDYGYQDRNYRGYKPYRRGNPRAAVERCIYAVEKDARRAGYRYANVTEIRDIDRERRGWEIRGRLVVDGNRGYGRYNTRYNRYNSGYDGYDPNYNRRGRYGRYNNGSIMGRFTCDISRGRIVDIDYRGIRGLR